MFIAGTWTAVALIVLSGGTRLVLTTVAWLAAIVASLVTVVWVRVPGWIPATISVAAGWSAAMVFPALAVSVRPLGLVLFLLGGIVYTVGAIVYALQRPDLHPAFGYHELFHALVVAGVVCHYAVFAFFLLPLAAS